MGRFPRKQISLRKPDFRRVFNQNEKSADKLLVVLARPNGLTFSRLGLAIAKKNTARAVDRNRVKRLIRESFMHHQPFNVAFDAVVMSRQGIALKNNQQIFQSLAHHWQSINKKLQRQDI